MLMRRRRFGLVVAAVVGWTEVGWSQEVPPAPTPEEPAVEEASPGEPQVADPAEGDAAATVTAEVQAEAAEGAAPDEEIVVTGSRIARNSFSNPDTVRVISSEQLKQSGAQNMGDVLQHLTSQPVSDGGRTDGGTTGANLRGLGQQATLVLVNGKRLVPSGSYTSATQGDLGVIPVAMIERIEVLAGGAAAIYGSDAVAGVVNVITRRNLDGARVELQGMTTGRLDHRSFGGSFALGSVSKKASVQLGVSASMLTPLSNAARDYTNRNGKNSSQSGNPPTYLATVAGAPTMAPISVPDPNCGGSGIWVDSHSYRSSATSNFPDPMGTVCRLDFNDYLQLAAERSYVNVMATADYDISDNLRLFSETLFTRFTQTGMLPPSYPLTQIPTYTWDTSPEPADFNRIFNQVVAADRARGIVSPLDPNNDGINDVTGIKLLGRPAGSNRAARPNQRVSHTFQLRAGIKGDLADVLPGFGWELSGGYGVSAFQLRNTDALIDKIASAPLACPAELMGVATTPRQRLAAGCANLTSTGRLDYIAATYGTTPGRADWQDYLDASGRFVGMAAALPTPYTNEVHDKLHGEEILDTISTLADVNGELHGKLLPLPGGDLGFALGAQYRHETRAATYDDDSYEGNLAFIGPNPANQNQRDVWGAYLEFGAPILPGVELSLAARYDQYSGRGQGSLSPKGGVVFNVGRIADLPRETKLVIRGSAAHSFRAPDLFQTANQCQSNITNFMVKGASTYRTVRFCGNSNLENEAGDAINASVEAAWGGFDVLAGFWWVRYSDLIVAESALDIVRLCQESNTCGTAPFTTPLPELQGQPRLSLADPNDLSTLTMVATSYHNTGEVLVKGIEFAGGFTAKLGPAGAARLGVDGNLLLSYMQATQRVDPITGQSALGPSLERAGKRNYPGPMASQPRLKLRVPLSWSLGIHSVMLTGNYVSSLVDEENPVVGPAGPTGEFAHIDAWLTLDLSYSLSFKAFDDKLTMLQIGARNLLDADPPWVNTTGGFLPLVHDPRGLMLFASVNQAL